MLDISYEYNSQNVLNKNKVIFMEDHVQKKPDRSQGLILLGSLILWFGCI